MAGDVTGVVADLAWVTVPTPDKPYFPPWPPKPSKLHSKEPLPIYLSTYTYVLQYVVTHILGELSLTDLSPASPAKSPAPQITPAQTPRPAAAAAVPAGPRSTPCSNRRNTKTSAAS